MPVIRLDDYVIRREIDRVALLKIDTEGMELEVLRGASEVLARTALVAMETHGDARHREVLDRLRSAGFHIDGDAFARADDDSLPDRQVGNRHAMGLDAAERARPPFIAILSKMPFTVHARAQDRRFLGKERH